MINQMMTVLMGAALLSGAAFAEPDGPQGPGPRDEGQGFRPEGDRRARMEQHERMMGPRDQRGPREQMGRQEGPCPEGACPGMCPQGRGGPGGERQQMQMRHGGPMMGRGPQEIPGPMRLKEAGATDQQIEALKKLGNDQQLKRIDLQAAVEKAETVLQQAMQGEAPDEKAVLKDIDALHLAKAELMKLEISSKLKAHEILGAELVKKIREMGPPAGMERPGAGPRGDDDARRDAPPPPPERPQGAAQK